ncbi:MAG: SGNH/GDSL hydrolase family protein [Candidatus Erginobacter occultus]|nr:SGNH/GDSL hydrolase family protein [Candidatus Erginobacter occultus]
MTRHPWKTPCFAAISIFLGLLAGLLLAEAAVRIIFRGLPDGLFHQRGYFVKSPHPLAAYEHLPNSTYHEGMYRINSRGFRGPEYPPLTPEGTCRIAALGDSYTFGAAVTWEDTWVRKLEIYLNELVKNCRVEILNFGVQAYNTRNELGLLESKVLEFHPEMVLLGHLINDDFYNYIRFVRGNLMFHYEEDPDQRIPLPSSLKQFFYNHSLLYRYLSTQYLNLFRDEIEAQRAREQQNQNNNWCPPPEKRRPVDAESLRGINRLCKKNDITLVILDFPVAPWVKSIREKPADTENVSFHLKKLAEELAIKYIDLFPVLVGHNGKKLWLTPGDHHPNAELSDLYAKYLAGILAPLIQTEWENRHEVPSHSGPLRP